MRNRSGDGLLQPSMHTERVELVGGEIEELAEAEKRARCNSEWMVAVTCHQKTSY